MSITLKQHAELVEALKFVAAESAALAAKAEIEAMEALDAAVAEVAQ